MLNIVKLSGKREEDDMLFPLFSFSFSLIFVENKKIEMLFQFRMNSINLLIRKTT